MTNISALFDVMLFTVIVNKKALNLVCTWLMFLMHDQNSIEEYLFEVVFVTHKALYKFSYLVRF